MSYTTKYYLALIPTAVLYVPLILSSKFPFFVAVGLGVGSEILMIMGGYFLGKRENE